MLPGLCALPTLQRVEEPSWEQAETTDREACTSAGTAVFCVIAHVNWAEGLLAVKVPAAKAMEVTPMERWTVPPAVNLRGWYTQLSVIRSAW